MVWKCGKEPDGPVYEDSEPCACGNRGAETPTLFKSGTPEYAAWDKACKAEDKALIAQLEEAARVKAGIA